MGFNIDVVKLESNITYLEMANAKMLEMKKKKKTRLNSKTMTSLSPSTTLLHEQYKAAVPKDALSSVMCSQGRQLPSLHMVPDITESPIPQPWPDIWSLLPVRS